MMRKIYEFKVFDILKDKDNEKFLDKVKKENPELYVNFLNIIGNKGLSVAKERYKEHEPEYVNRKTEIEKKISDAKKKKLKKEKEEFEKQEVLRKNKQTIEEIENVMFSFDLDEIENEISKNKNIQEYLKCCLAKKRRVNKYYQNLKKSASTLQYELNNIYLSLEEVFYQTKIFLYDRYSVKNIIDLEHFYNIIEKKSEFTIYINLVEYVELTVDKNKEDDFLTYRNKYIKEKINKYRVSKEEIIDSIHKLSNVLSDEWYEDWKFERIKKKYNL